MKQMAQPDADAEIQKPNLKPLGRAQNMNLKFVWSPEVAKFFVANENYASLNNQVLAINYTLHRCKISLPRPPGCVRAIPHISCKRS